MSMVFIIVSNSKNNFISYIAIWDMLLSWYDVH